MKHRRRNAWQNVQVIVAPVWEGTRDVIAVRLDGSAVWSRFSVVGNVGIEDSEELSNIAHRLTSECGWMRNCIIVCVGCIISWFEFGA